MSAPVIAVTGSARRGRLMWLLNAFSIFLAGGRPRRVTVETGREHLMTCDGLLIGGGDDISASIYDGDITLDVRIDPFRDELEREALIEADKRNIPVLGICRGSQMLNIHRGGNLYQEVKTAFGLKSYRRTILPVKRITLAPGSRLAKLTGYERFRANSIHHQSINRVGEGLKAVGKDEYGITQAIELDGARFLFGVQWHPEFLFWKPPHRRLFRGLVNSARSKSP